MRDENTILADEAEAVRELQLTIRRQLDIRRKAMKAFAYDSGIGYSTLLTYFPDRESDKKPAALSLAALRRLVGVMPSDLLSLLLPDGWQIVRVPEQVDHDAISEAVRDYLDCKERAHRPDSPAGRDIAPCEDAELREKFTVISGGRG